MRYILQGLDCAVCAAKIERELRKIKGLEEAVVDFASQSVDLPPELVSQAQAAITRIEPDVRLVKPSSPAAPAPETEEEEEERRTLFFIAASLILLFAGLVLGTRLRTTPYAWAEYVLFLSAYLLVGWRVIRRAGLNLLHSQFLDENFLMTVSTVGAIAIHRLSEAVAVMLFYALGEYLEDRAVSRSRRSIAALLDIRPDRASLETPDGIKEVRPEDVPVDATIVVKPGERVPLDGVVCAGTSFLDTSALTGESVPRKVEPGEEVLAGMVNGQGLLTVRVTKTFSESAVSRILRLVQEAGERKAPTERFITVFARYYTPAVVAGAVGVALLPPLFLPGAAFSEWVYRALVLLVISCPCALVVSIPLGYFGGIGSASRHGILVKGANFLDALANLTAVAFDKTGTLTQGVFRVTKVVPYNGFSSRELLAAAAAAEAYSNHPIAHSIRQAYGWEVPQGRVADYREIPAHGVSARVEGKQVLVGNDRLLHREKIAHGPEVCQVEGTAVHVAIDGTFAGYIVISDELKEDAGVAVTRLKELGVKEIALLTGDEETTARHVAETLGLDRFFAGLLPEDKVRIVEKLTASLPDRQRQKLAFVGDGVNDAPVITRADVGVAMGALGSDAAIEAADVVLMDSSPARLAAAVEIARYTRGIVRQNIFLALGIKAFFLTLGLFGVATIWEAVFADVGVTLLAVLNATRTLRYRVTI